MTSIEDQLTLSAPSVPVYSVDLDRELLIVNARAEDLAPARSRPRRRLAVGALAALGVIAAGTGTAGAAGLLPWFDTAPAHGIVTTSTGVECKLTFGVKALADPSHPLAPATNAAAVATAESILKHLDVSSIDIADATRGMPARATVDSESGPAQSVVEYETDAVSRVVQERVDDALGEQGLPSAAISVSTARSCDGDTK